MKRIFFPILIIIISFIIGYQVLSVWRSLFPQMNPSREKLAQAIETYPSNPDPYYRMALFYQWDLRNIDLKESVRFFKKAIERNPLEQQYWIHLAKTLRQVGDPKASEKALENAIRVFPAGYQGRWVTGNLLLQWGAFEKALPHFVYILSHYPNQSGLVYEVLGRAIKDPDLLLEEIVPRDPLSFRQFLSFLYETGDSGSAKKAWKIRTSYGFSDNREEALRHIEFLIARGELNEAFRAWKERMQSEGLPISPDGNLMTNGGFEKEKVLGGGFDWRINPLSGAKVSFDPGVASEGKQSLKIVFDGKENVDFQHVSQCVAWRPDTKYVFRAQMKTKDVTTKSGLKIEISGIGPAFYKASESLTGDQGWREVSIVFRTPAQSQGGWVRIRRERTDKFDRFISGTVWIDDVSLKEKGY